MFNKKIKSLNYLLMIELMKRHKNQIQKNITNDILELKKEQWFEIIKKICNNKNIESNNIESSISFNFIQNSKNSNRFTFYYYEDSKLYFFKMLPEGYKYQYFGYKRWEYVQSDKITTLTVILIIITFLQPFIRDIFYFIKCFFL